MCNETRVNMFPQHGFAVYVKPTLGKPYAIAYEAPRCPRCGRAGIRPLQGDGAGRHICICGWSA